MFSNICLNWTMKLGSKTCSCMLVIFYGGFRQLMLILSFRNTMKMNFFT